MSNPLQENVLANPVGTTLDRYIMRKQSEFPFATGELSQLLRDIALAGKIINREVNRAGLIDIAGAFGNQNIQGEQQQKLDVVANIRFIRALKNGGQACAILSEEEDDIIYTGNDQGKYVVAMDPLDGSSNIDVNVSIGTIFSIYRRVTPVGTQATREDFLQGGRKQVAAGYVLYGSSTMLVYTTGHGVAGFTYENSLGEFFLSHPEIRIPQDGATFSCNEGYWYQYPESIRAYLTTCKQRGYSGRYIGSLVADFHRNLFKGGIYLYPPTEKTPEGKLRLLYECYPLALLIEQAGGQAQSGHEAILDIEPVYFHQRCPIYVGSTDMVKEVLSLANAAHEAAC
ncbi:MULTISPECIES: class 1 fructose-bisphosphatase [Hymenobacter]|uniref:Fructose-1,6-bisphosphatase class 1 n=1 Tax=Hymenobacter jejuensis TaxID=2502781 RepID=A0A5B8A5A7_9BACT|nr:MULTISPECIES: class 1 fructose-bisphosphatase [Hymenobacter]MBC6992042.1 class 1 fructose-bisphosphatase [Hymenobacter sp. BT491]QDA62399.1 class 1 fructose-bisphosphatase [Hymenobacter jejuensis]